MHLLEIAAGLLSWSLRITTGFVIRAHPVEAGKKTVAHLPVSRRRCADGFVKLCSLRRKGFSQGSSSVPLSSRRLQLFSLMTFRRNCLSFTPAAATAGTAPRDVVAATENAVEHGVGDVSEIALQA